MNRRMHKPAFTLVELILVLLIVATLAGLAAPTLRGFVRGRRLPNTATSLVTVARWCRVQAISQGIVYRLNVDVTAGKWWVTKDDGTGQNFKPVTEEIGLESPLPEGMSLETDIKPSDDGMFITFEPGGRSDLATITLHADGGSLSVTCDTPLGLYHLVPPGTEGSR